MKIKVQGKRDAIDVDVNDKIMFNGAVYILMTRQIFGGWHWYNPTISKTQFNKLLKNGFVRLSDTKYIAYGGETCDMYEFVGGEKE